MNVEPVDLGDEVRNGFKFRLPLAPVVIGAPITSELLHRGERYVLRRIRYQFALGPLRGIDAFAQIGNLGFRKIPTKRTNRIFVSCLLCCTGLGHVVLLWGSFGFPGSKCLPRTESDAQTHHRTRFKKTTPRAITCLLHDVLHFLSTDSTDEKPISNRRPALCRVGPATTTRPALSASGSAQRRRVHDRRRARSAECPLRPRISGRPAASDLAT